MILLPVVLFPLGLLFGLAVLIALGVVFGARVAALCVLVPAALAALAGMLVLFSFVHWLGSFR